jgi:hypothetical protein
MADGIRILDAELLTVDIGNGCLIDLSESIELIEAKLTQTIPKTLNDPRDVEGKKKITLDTNWDVALQGKIERGWRYAIGATSIAVIPACIEEMNKPIWRLETIGPERLRRFLICVAAVKRLFHGRELIDYKEFGTAFVQQRVNLDVGPDDNPLKTDLLVWDKWGRGWYCPQFAENSNVYFNVATLTVSGFVGKDHVQFEPLPMLDAFKLLVKKGNEVGATKRLLMSMVPLDIAQTMIDEAYEHAWSPYILQAGIVLNGKSLEAMIVSLGDHIFQLPCTKSKLDYTERRKLVHFIINLSLEGFQ